MLKHAPSKRSFLLVLFLFVYTKISFSGYMDLDSYQTYLDQWVLLADHTQKTARALAIEKIKLFITSDEDTLNLSSLGLTEIPDLNGYFGGRHKIKTCDLSHNQFKIIPSYIR